MQDFIEAILRRKLGLDANSVGSRLIARALEQRQKACQLSDRAAYLAHLKSSPQELEQLIEAVVIPETWFFRDQGAFEALRKYIEQRTISKQLRILSLPCSTGEEPYSISMTLLEAGLSPAQFRIDAIDISERAVTKAKRGVYRKNSFRGSKLSNFDHYFHQTSDSYEVRSLVRESVRFFQGNILEPHFLVGKQYDIIFCRNLLIYLDESARDRAINALDQALVPMGLLFLGAVETPQLANRAYTQINQPGAFAFQKQSISWANSAPIKQSTQKLDAKTNSSVQNPKVLVLSQRRFSTSAHSILTPLENAKQLADRGQFSSAVELCKSYVRAHPTQASAYLLLGEIYQALNQPSQAEQSFQKAIYLNPNNYEALIHLALLKEQQGKRAESERLRKRVQRLIDSEYQQSHSGG